MDPPLKATFLTIETERHSCRTGNSGLENLSPYQFADTQEGYLKAIQELDYPVLLKPVMSSSGKGKSTIKTEADILPAWNYTHDKGTNTEQSGHY
jgi:phosphoribosylglycinamide formyltransferase 2